MVAAEPKVSRPKVHISHCDADSGFVERLVAGIRRSEQFELSVTTDKEPLKRNWKSRFNVLIANADTVLFVLSPEAVESKVFTWQVAKTHELSKRTIPIVSKPLRNGGLPSQLASVKQLHFCNGRPFVNSLELLLNALDADADWLSTHTKLYARARAWERSGHSDAELLTDAEITAAKTWTFERSKDAPKPTALHMAFIEASENADLARRNGTPIPQFTSLGPAAPASSRFEIKRARRKPRPPDTTHEEGVLKPQSEFAELAAANTQLETRSTQRGPDPLGTDQIRLRQTGRPMQVVLGSLLVILTGAAVWQASSGTWQLPEPNRQAIVQTQARGELAEHLFVVQSDRIRRVQDKIECLLLYIDKDDAHCMRGTETSMSHVQVISAGDFDR